MTQNATYFSLSQAAERTGKSKSVISKALKDGTLSYTEKNDNGYKIDPAELFRVFPENEKNENENGKKERSRTLENGIENVIRIKELEIRLEVESKEKDFYKEQVSKVEQDRDDWKKQAQTLLLQNHVEKPPEKPSGWQESFSAPPVAETQRRLSGAKIFGILSLFFVALILGGGLVYLWPRLQSPVRTETPVAIPAPQPEKTDVPQAPAPAAGE